MARVPTAAPDLTGDAHQRRHGRFVRAVSRREAILSYALLAMIPVLAAAVYVTGQRYDPRLFALDESLLSGSRPTRTKAALRDLPAERDGEDAGSPAPAAGGAGAFTVAPRTDIAGWTIDGTVERFTADTLYQKIDGRADAYLQHGVRSLQCVSYTDGPRFADVFVYDMGTPDQAAAVFAAERPGQSIPVALGTQAYRAGASYFFTAGRHYVQVVASDSDDILAEVGLRLARAAESDLRAGAQAGIQSAPRR